MHPDAFAEFLDAVRAFVREDVPHHREELFATERLPEGLRGRMATLGLFGMEIPDAWGGLGLSCVQTCEVIEALCHGPQALVRWAGPGAAWLARAESDPQVRALAERYVGRILSGHSRIAFTLTEPEAGSDAAAIRTRADRQDDHYVLNGRKHLISFAGATDLYLVFAKTDPDAGAYGVSAFLVESSSPGLRAGPTQPKLGLDGMPVGDVVFENCRVPASHRIGAEGHGFLIAMEGLDRGRLQVIAAVAVGAAQAALDFCVAHTRDNDAVDREWARAVLADMATHVTAARTLVRDCALRVDAGRRITRESAMCKLFCAEMNDRVADAALQLVGEAALEPQHPVNRWYRDARLGRIWDGTSEIQRLIIGRSVLRGE